MQENNRNLDYNAERRVIKFKLKPSDEQLKDFSKTSNRILQQQLQAVLTQKNIQSMSESIISNQVESQLSPYIKQLSAMISDLSVQISDLSDMASSSSIETDLNRLDGRLQELTTSVTTLEEHLNRLMA
jgi:predicted component of viral defense system (DUF524 family)